MRVAEGTKVVTVAHAPHEEVEEAEDTEDTDGVTENIVDVEVEEAAEIVENIVKAPNGEDA
jgi:hypothetical protein